MEKTCPDCQRTLPIDLFRGARGPAYAEGRCRECRDQGYAERERVYKRGYMRARGRALADLKAEHEDRYRELLRGHMDALRAAEHLSDPLDV